MNDLTGLALRLPAELHSGSLLDAYLVAAGMAQITADHLHGEIRLLAATSHHLAGRDARLARFAAAALARMARATRPLRGCRPATRRAVHWQRDLALVVDALADALAAGRQPDPAAGLLEHAEALARRSAALPRALRSAVVRLPACFQAFDQRPADLFELARRVRYAPQTPLLVVGIRTSGSYLAPLCGAQLRADGYRDVHVLSIRPGGRLLRQERALVRSVARRGGCALVIDDPPVTGSTIVAAAGELHAGGFPDDQIVLVLALFGTAALPPALRKYAAVLLDEPEWSVRADLEPAAVRSALAGLLGQDESSVAVEPAAAGPRQPRRGHVRTRFTARWTDHTGGVREADLVVEGVGLGYLGAQALAEAHALESFTPRVFGLLDGLLYREWLPEQRRLDPAAIADEEAVVTAVARYVAERRRLLVVPADLSLRIAGEEPAWEVASAALSTVFGRAALPARVLLTDRIAKRLLKVARPIVVDGNTDLAQWFGPNAQHDSLVKVNLGEDRFTNLSSSCFDPAFDLAGATALAQAPSLSPRLRQAYAKRAGEHVDADRWLLYELVHLRARQRTEPERAAELRRARARAVQRYFAEVYLSDVDAPSTGQLCVLDVDGVLETEHLGFPAMTPASGLALRALMRHGYRPVLATGRSVDEVAERCEVYGLAGGAAEYGGATYVSEGSCVSELVPAPAAARLQRLRDVLRQMDGVVVDESHQRSVRASRPSPDGGRGLQDDQVNEALSRAAAAGVGVIAGDGQTDFVAGVNKAVAIRALAAQLGAEPALALAVGDTGPDAPLGILADLACAPAHAHPSLRRAGFQIMTRPYQAGLAEAVGTLIGHAPGACSACRPAPASPDRRLLLGVLAAQERGGRRIPLQAAKLAARIA
ncbi:MAG: hypothetical protein QOG68_1079 [Solirubrobacteraceae bacterium]|nr:hypothetical protein [Solirubrobacteraceae bacterium]